MRVIHRFAVASIAVLLAAAPAAAVDILPPMDGSSWDRWEDLAPVILEFDDRDWERFVDGDASEFLLPPLEAVDGDLGVGGLDGLFTQVWERP